MSSLIRAPPKSIHFLPHKINEWRKQMKKLQIMHKDGQISVVCSSDYFTTRCLSKYHEYINEGNRILLPFSDDETHFSIIITREKWKYIQKSVFTHIVDNENERKLKCEIEEVVFQPKYFNFKQGDESVLIVISDDIQDIVDEIVADLRNEEAYQRQVYRHHAHYSLDMEDGIEYSTIIRTSNDPEVAMALKIQHCSLCRALNSLSEIQGKRIEAHYLNGISQPDIAKADGVTIGSVSITI